MNNYHVWFDDEGENKGDSIETFSDFDAAVQYFRRYEDDVNDATTSVYVRSADRSVRELRIEQVEDAAHGVNGYNSSPPIDD